MDTNMHSVEFDIHDINELDHISNALLPHLKGPMIIGLSGDMGTGKTTFVRSICHALNSPDWVNSPTYAIMQKYSSQAFEILHIDLYRLKNDADIDLLDIHSQITTGTIAFVEWINKTTMITPDLDIHFTRLGETRRKIVMSSNKEWVLAIK